MPEPHAPATDVTDLAAFRARRAGGGGNPAPPPPRGTVTLLGAEAATGAVDREALAAAVGAHGGACPVDHGPPATFVAVFARASDAAAAALDAQRVLRTDAGAAVRMALHTGDAEVVAGRYSAGPALDRCARLRALAHPGQVLVSGPAADVLADALPDGAGLLPAGLHRLRDPDRPLRVYQLLHPDLPAHFPALRTADRTADNLPVQLTGFVGRGRERTDLLALLAGQRMVTLVGVGGCGKTRLAAQVAADSAGSYPDGLGWVELAPLTDPGVVPWALLAALGLGHDRGLDPVERLAQYLTDSHFLLVVDNCEHVIDAAAAVLDRLLRACPALTVLATSREPLAVRGEVLHRVGPLAVPPLGTPVADLTVESVAGYEGVQLFVRRAGESRTGFALTASNAAPVAAICARLDGLPLALELAAARIRTLGPERILAGLDDRFRLLTATARTGAARQHTLQASMEWSHDLLRPAEQAMFRRLAACSGSFDVDAAVAVASAPGGGLDARDAPGLLADLVDKSLVTFDGDRYALLQTLQAFAAARLREAGETAATRDRHAAHFLARVEAAALQMRQDLRPQPLAALAADHDNLRAALEWSAGRDAEQSLRLVVAMTFFWHTHGHFSEGLAWLRRVLDGVPDDRSPLRCRAIGGLGYLSLNCAELSSGFGVGELTDALARARELADPGLAVLPLAALGATRVFGLPGDPEQTLIEAVSAARRNGDGWDTWCALWWLAFYWIYTRNRPGDAAPVLAEVDALSARSDNTGAAAWNDVVRLLAAMQQGQLREAAAMVGQIVATACAVGDPVLETYAVGFGSDALVSLGAYAEAEALGTRTAARLHRSLDACRQGFVELTLARLALARGDLAEALRQSEEVAPLVLRAGWGLLVQWLAHVRGRVALECGDPAAAREEIEAAAAWAEQTGVPWDLTAARYHQGLLARAAGDAREAERRFREALAIDAAHGFRGRAADTLEALAGALATGAEAEAAGLLGAADALRAQTGAVRRPLDEPGFRATAGRLRGVLGENAYACLHRDGAQRAADVLRSADICVNAQVDAGRHERT